MRLIALVLSGLLAACASSSAPPAAAPSPPRTAWIVAADGRAAGQATFFEGPQGVLIRLEFAARALPAGWHGVHLHQRGDCSDFAAGFQAAGGHVSNPARRMRHGLMHEDGPEPGDMPNIFASPGGPFGAELLVADVTLGSAPLRGRQPLLDGDGTALIVHASSDDQITQPIGNAGARIACAALTQLP
jgi:Cu-Zn family superoxide dismutase